MTGQLTVAELQERYSITRNPLYDRLKALSLKLGRDGNKSVASTEQIRELDDLHQHLKQGGTLKNYSPIGEVILEDSTVQYSTTVQDSTVQDNENNGTSRALSTVQRSTVQTVQDSAGQDSQLLLAVIEAMGRQRSPLDTHRDLKEASEEGWLLTTAEVKAIIGVKPLVKKGKSFYQRGIWKFTKVGKIGTQTSWKVEKEI